MPSRWSSICSRHFITSDFRDYLSRKCLKKTAIPSIITKNNISYETYHINPISFANSFDTNMNNNFICSSANASVNLIENNNVSSEISDENRHIYEKILDGCRLCGEHIDENLLNYPIFSVNDTEVRCLLVKCLPTIIIDQELDHPNSVCIECVSHLRQYAEYIDKVLAYQRDCSSNNDVINEISSRSESYQSCPVGEMERSKVTAGMFIKQEPINVKQEISDPSNRRPTDTPTMMKMQQKTAIDPQASVVSTNPINEDELEIQWTKGQNNAFCGLCDRFLASSHELKTHTCDSRPNVGAEAGSQNANCEIMEIITLNNSVSFIDLAEDDYPPVERILKIENSNEPDRRERVTLEHAYAKRGADELQIAWNLKQEIELNYDSSLDEAVLVKNNQSKAQRTLSRNTDIVKDSFTCTKCDQHFTTSVLLQEHMSKLHSLKNKICMICTAEFKSVHDYLVHKNKAHAQGHQCNQCKRKFSTKRTLNYHIRHSCAIDSKDFYYSCKHCGERIRNRIKLKNHITSCEICGCSYSQHYNLVRFFVV